MKPIEKSGLPIEEAHNLMAHITALHAYQALYTERIPRVIELAQQAKTYQPEDQFALSSISFALGWAYRFSGDLEAASQAFVETKSISLKSGNNYMAIAALCRAAYSQVMAGRLHQAMDSFHEAVQIATREGGRQLPVAGYAYVYMAGVYYEWNDLDTARRYSSEGAELCQRVGYIMDQVVGYAYLARTRQAKQDWDGAQDACQRAKRLSQMMKGYVYVRRWVEDSQVRLWLAQGNLDAAAQWSHESGLGVDDELNFMHDIDHIILARVLVALGREQPTGSLMEDAIGLLDRLVKMSEKAGWTGKGIEILVLQALALNALGQYEAALTSLKKALSLAKPEGYVRTFADEGEPMANLLRQVDSRDIDKDFVDKLLAAIKPDKAKAQPVATHLFVESLTEREREVLRLLGTELSGPEISRELLVSLNTMRTHTKNIYSKLAVSNRRAAIHRAEELNLI